MILGAISSQCISTSGMCSDDNRKFTRDTDLITKHILTAAAAAARLTILLLLMLLLLVVVVAQHDDGGTAG